MKAVKYYSLIVLFGMSMSASCQAHARTTAAQAPQAATSVEALP